jgi:hypothetical protein
MSDVMKRLQAKSDELSRVRDQIAQMLYESGEMLAQTEGGSMPSWDEIAEGCGPDDAALVDESQDACWQIRLDHLHRADNILALDGASCLTLATILIDQAAKQHADMEKQLWGKVERAAGFERGSLTGAPGVAPKVFL